MRDIGSDSTPRPAGPPSLLAATLLAAALLPGCVGVGYLGMYESENRSVREVHELRRLEQPLTTERLTSKLGEPDDVKEMDDGSERWTYDGSVCFNGVVVWALVPLPLALPIRRESDTYEVRDGIVERVDRIVFYERHATCGVIPGVCPGWGCETWGTYVRD